MINDSSLKYPSINEALIYVECGLAPSGVSMTLFLSYGITLSLPFLLWFSAFVATLNA